MLKEYFSIAFVSVMTHKLRAFLTMLGVIIGVSSVIILLSLGQSTKDEAANQIRGLGSNLVMVITSGDTEQYLPSSWLSDLKEKAKYTAYTPSAQGKTNYIIGGENYSISVFGTNQYYGIISLLEYSQGRYFSSVEVENKIAVTVIGKEVADRLYPDESALGKDLVIGGIPFKIIGVLEERGMSLTGTNLDRSVYIPYDFALSLYPQQLQKMYYISSESEETANQTKDSIESYLSRSLPGQNGYAVIAQAQMLDVLDTLMGMLTTLLAGIAAISLLVGGIGIMNIMLVTVRERTKEIGIRKALGAGRANILMQFLLEAIIITVIGGLIGLGISFIGTRILEGVAGYPVVMGLSSVVLSLVFSITIGIVFGLYPAYKAAKMEPVEALRFE